MSLKYLSYLKLNLKSPIIKIIKDESYYYCWSHGYGPNRDHTSKNCRFPASGQRYDATTNNMLGGNNTIHRRRGEVPIFVKSNKLQTPIKAQTTHEHTELTEK